MRKLAAILLISLVMGCLGSQEPEKNNTVVNDTLLAAPSLSLSGFVKSGEALSISFDEPVIVTAVTFDNGPANITKANPKSYSIAGPFAEGNHTLSLSAEDAAGNKLSNLASWFFVDSTAPTMTVDPENNEQVTNTTVAITLVFSEPVTISEAKLGSTELSFASTDSKTFTLSKTLAEGSYTLAIAAADRAGNSINSTSSFTINTIEPDTTAPPKITGVNASDTGNGGEISLVWDASSVTDFREYRIYKDTSSFSSASGMSVFATVTAKSTRSRTVAGLTNGANYCFAVTAVDSSGNELYTVTASCAKPSLKDRAAPTITVNYPTGTVSNTSSPQIKVITNEIATCKYSVSNTSGQYWTYTNLTATLSRDSAKTTHTYTHSSLANGTWYAYVSCKDESDNTMSSPEEWSFVIAYAAPPDTTAPTITISAPTATAHSTNSTTLSFSASESTSWCGYAMDGATFNAATTGMTVNSSEGSNTVTVKCTDNAGNNGTASVTYTVDTVAPTISGVSSTKTNVTANVTWTTSEAADSYVYYGTACGSLSSTASDATRVTSHNVPLSGLNNATAYYFKVKSTDAAGNYREDDNSGSCYTFTTDA